MYKIIFFFLAACLIALPLFAEPVEITVTAKAPSDSVENKSQQVKIISGEEIDSVGANSTIEILEKCADLNIKQYGGFGSTATLYIRNFSGSAVAVLVDGVQVNSAQSGEFDLNRIPPESIERIEVVSGACDSRYSVSGAAGGIVNIVTKTGSARRFSAGISTLSYENSPFDTNRADFFAGGKNWSFSTSYTNAKNAFTYETGGKIKQRINAGAEGLSADAGFAGLLFDGALAYTLKESFYYGSVFCPGTQTSVTIGFQRDFFNSSSFSFRVPEAFSGFADVSGKIFYKYDGISYVENVQKEPSGSNYSNHKLHSAGANVSAKIFCTDFALMNVSVDFTDNILCSTDCTESVVSRPDAGISSGFDIYAGCFTIYPFCKLLIRENNYVPVPKIGVKCDIPFKTEASSGLQIKILANAYRMFMFPTLNQLYWKDTGYAKGNPDLKNEDGYGADLSFKTEVLRNGIRVFSADIGAFSAYYMDKIQWASGAGGKLIPKNMGEAAYFGGNVSLSAVPAKWFSFGIQYDLSLTYLLSDGLTLADNKRIMYTPVNKIGGVLTFGFPFGVLSFYPSWTDKRYVSNANIRYLEPYFLLDINFTADIGKGFKLSVALNNATNSRYYEVDEYPMPGISLKAGLKWNYGM